MVIILSKLVMVVQMVIQQMLGTLVLIVNLKE